MMESLKTAGMKCDTVRVNVLTPSPERALPNKPEVTVISDDSGTKHRFILGCILRTVCALSRSGKMVTNVEIILRIACAVKC